MLALKYFTLVVLGYTGETSTELTDWRRCCMEKEAWPATRCYAHSVIS